MNIRYFLEELLELNDGELSRAGTIGELFQLIKQAVLWPAVTVL